MANLNVDSSKKIEAIYDKMKSQFWTMKEIRPEHEKNKLCETIVRIENSHNEAYEKFVEEHINKCGADDR